MNTKHLILAGLFVTFFTLIPSLANAQVSSPVKRNSFGIRGELAFNVADRSIHTSSQYINATFDAFSPAIGLYWKYHVINFLSIGLSSDIRYYSATLSFDDYYMNNPEYSLTLSNRNLYALTLMPKVCIEFDLGFFSLSPGIGINVILTEDSDAEVEGVEAFQEMADAPITYWKISASYRNIIRSELKDRRGIVVFYIDADLHLSKRWNAGLNVSWGGNINVGIHTSMDF